MNQINKQEAIQMMINDKKIRIATTKASHYWFFHLYFSHYIHYKTAEFQKEMIALTENESIKNMVIVSFRGSAKSSIMTMSYPIWAILGKQQKKFVLILGLTQRQAKQHLINLKQELDNNNLLKQDLGPFEEDNEWGSYSLVIPKLNARITAASSEQSIRGIRHGQYRPDLIICDDIEDLLSVKTTESRDKTHQWLTGEVIPCGSKDTRIIIVGNLLHEDSLLMRLKKSIINKQFNAIFREYPILDSNNKPLWPDRFKNSEDILELKRTIANEQSWQREFMLKIISDEDRVVRPEWIQYYDSLPDKDNKQNPLRFSVLSVDLAISQKEGADNTAIVIAKIWGYGKNLRIYILPNIINSHLGYIDVLEKIKMTSNILKKDSLSKIYVEDVAYQRAVIESLRKENYPAEGISVAGQDKKSRLSLTTPAIQNGNVLFPKYGVENLISQLIGFGKERHDDLADAFSMLINKIISDDKFKEHYVFPELILDKDAPPSIMNMEF